MEEEYDINENTSKIKNFEKNFTINENSTVLTPSLNLNNCKNQVNNNISFNTIKYNKKGNDILMIKGKYFLIRKRKRNIKHKHTYKSFDNISRKIKSWIISYLIKFINKKFEEKEKNYKKRYNKIIYNQ